MISARPQHVFESMEELENKVLAASTPLLLAFHETAVKLAAATAWHELRKTSAKDLSSLLCTYLRTFKVHQTLNRKP